jgi:hypothetical protein
MCLLLLKVSAGETLINWTSGRTPYSHPKPAPQIFLTAKPAKSKKEEDYTFAKSFVTFLFNLLNLFDLAVILRGKFLFLCGY